MDQQASSVWHVWPAVGGAPQRGPERWANADVAFLSWFTTEQAYHRMGTWWLRAVSIRGSINGTITANDEWALGTGRKEMFYFTTNSTHFIYGYMASNILLRTILIVRKETRCRHIGYSLRLTARVLLYAPSHRQDSTYHGLCYTSRRALAGTRNSPPWRIDPTTHRTMSERPYHGATSRSLGTGGGGEEKPVVGSSAIGFGPLPLNCPWQLPPFCFSRRFLHRLDSSIKLPRVGENLTVTAVLKAYCYDGQTVNASALDNL